MCLGVHARLLQHNHCATTHTCRQPLLGDIQVPSMTLHPCLEAQGKLASRDDDMGVAAREPYPRPPHPSMLTGCFSGCCRRHMHQHGNVAAVAAHNFPRGKPTWSVNRERKLSRLPDWEGLPRACADMRMHWRPISSNREPSLNLNPDQPMRPANVSLMVGRPKSGVAAPQRVRTPKQYIPRARLRGGKDSKMVGG